MASTAILAIRILADAKGAQKGMQDASKATGRFAAGLGRASTVAAAGLAGLGALAVSAAKAAAEDAQAQVVLAQALRNTAGATKDQVAATEEWISKTALATGVADDQLRPALANLVRGTKDLSKAQTAMGLALDVSAATGKDLESVTAAMAKAYGGNTTALGRLVPGLSKAVLKTKDMTKITAELQKMVGGTAAAAADTAAGKYERFRLAMDETKESAGAALLPVMEKLSTVMLTIATLASRHQGAFLAIAGALAAVATAVLVVNAALKVYQATMVVIQVVQAATFLTNPIFLVVAAIALLVVGFVLLWKRSKRFRDFVLAMWKTIKRQAAAVAAFLRNLWQTTLRIIQGFFAAFKTAVRAVIDDIKSRFNTAVATIKSVWNSLTSVFTAPFKAVNTAIETVIGWIDKLIDKIGQIDFTPGFSIPDWLTPFSAGPAPPTAPSLSTRARGGRAAGGGGRVVINIHGAIDPEGTARQIERILGGHGHRVGTLPTI